MNHRHLARVLVTGASGTLGYNIVRHIAAEYPQTQVHLLLRTEAPHLFADFPNVSQQRADMNNTAAFCGAALDFQPNAIIHCAASGVRPSNVSWFDIIDLNVAATVQLFRASCEIPGCHFIHISTGLVYTPQDRPCREGDPAETLHPYGASKAASDCLLRAGAERLDRHLTVVRPFSFTGLHDGGRRLFPALLQCAQEGTPFVLSAGTQVRDFCAVQDVAEAIGIILERGDTAGRNTYNVGSGKSQTLRCMVEDIVQQLGLSVDLQFGALPFQAYEPMHLVADLERIRSLGWKPRTNLAYAVWELARTQYPQLAVQRPGQFL